ncbi:MAG: T9SS type A sorting domain-containing protein [Chlorobi bacterium]|nr:T9SS type A sorting domain-containing protein [Chlorobiota bacterium]
MFLFFLFFDPYNIFSQSQTVSSFFPDVTINVSNDPSPGYFFLAAPLSMDTLHAAYLAAIDNTGIPLFFRRMPFPVLAMSLQQDGRITYLSLKTDYLYFMDTLLEVIDSITTVGYDLNSHDYAVTNDGHIFLLGIDIRHKDMSQVVPGGDPNATVLDAVIQEFDEQKNLVFSWKTSDHFSVLDGNENSDFVDLTAGIVDYCHVNAIAVDSDTSILISSRHMDEITKIDRRTGDILWRLGGKNNMFTFVNDTLKFSHQHSIRKLANGNILLFDNGNLHNPPVSSAVEYAIDEKQMTVTLVRRFNHHPPVFSTYIGSTVRMKNGNTVVDWGNVSPSLTEYHPDGSVALDLDFSAHSYSRQVFKFNWQPRVFYTGTDTVDFGMWNGMDTLRMNLPLHNNLTDTLMITGVSVLERSFFVLDSFPVKILPAGNKDIHLGFYPAVVDWGLVKDKLLICSDNDTQRIARQVVLIGRKEDTTPPQVSFTPDSAGVPRNAVVRADFSEPVRLSSNTDLDYQNVDTLFIFRKDNANGEPVPFDAVVSTDKMHVVVTPVDSLEPDQTYYIALYHPLEDYSGNVLSPASAAFSTGETIASSGKLHRELITVFPNPATGRFTLYFPDASRRKVTVYSLTGKVVFKKRNILTENYSFDLSGRLPGMYFIHIGSPDNLENTILRIILL